MWTQQQQVLALVQFDLERRREASGSLFKSRCFACHGSGGQPPNLTTYDSAKAGANRSLIRMQAGTMPPAGALPAGETALFSSWISGAFALGVQGPNTAPIVGGAGSLPVLKIA